MDRNSSGARTRNGTLRRPPRGGRGSQRVGSRDRRCWRPVAPREGGVDRNSVVGAIVIPCRNVAPREGGVDRNSDPAAFGVNMLVAPREGGVDRNHPESLQVIPSSAGRPPRGGRGSQLLRRAHEQHAARVAPREGGVDRNRGRSSGTPLPKPSPPARGAWIATRTPPRTSPATPGSPPARGAWIATGGRHSHRQGPLVAPREGGVDRNSRRAFSSAHRRCSRPPRGGRGSQPHPAALDGVLAGSRPPRGGRGSQLFGGKALRATKDGRPPRGGRGSQPHAEPAAQGVHRVLSPPARGAWIATRYGRCAR